MNDWARLGATAIVWGILGTILIVGIVTGGGVSEEAFLFLAFGTGATGIIWGTSGKSRKGGGQERGKEKNSARLERLTEDLEEEELATLEELMNARRSRVQLGERRAQPVNNPGRGTTADARKRSPAASGQD